MSSNRRAHWGFWAIGALALIWNLAGCVNFVVQLDPEVLSHYRPAEQAIVAGRPLWATAGFGLGVFGGAAGSLMLLLRLKAAFHVFVLSLLGVLVTMVHTLGSGIAFGPGEIAGIIVAPVAVSAFLVWYSRYAQRQNREF